MSVRFLYKAVSSYPGFDVINIYRFASSTQIQKFTGAHLDQAKTTVIMTDCNLDDLKSPNNTFTASLEQRGFKQLVTKPTHILGGLLDHIYFYSPSPEASCKLYKAHSVFWSDHTCLAAILKTTKQQTSAEQEEEREEERRPVFADEIVAG